MKEIEKKSPHQITKSMTFISSWSLNYCFHVPLFELSRNCFFFFLANEIYVLKETLKCNCLLYLVKKKINVFIHPRTSYKNIFITQNQKFIAFKL